MTEAVELPEIQFLGCQIRIRQAPCHSSNNWKTKIICKLSHNSNALFGWSWFHDPGHQVGSRNCTLNDFSPGCKAKSPRSWPKRLLGIPSWEPNFFPKKNAEIGDCNTSKAFSVFFVQVFFSTKNSSKSCQQNGAQKNVQLLKSSETSKKVLSRNKVSKFLGEELGSKIPASWSWGAKSGWHLASRCCQETWSHLALEKDNSMEI